VESIGLIGRTSRYLEIMTRFTIAMVGTFCVASVGTCVGASGGDGRDGQPGLGSGGSSLTTDLPCDVETVLGARCWGCHGASPAVGLPALTNVASLRAPARSDGTKTNAEVALARMQNDLLPMPPAPAANATTDEIAALSAWVAAGYPSGSGCAPICSSQTMWTGGNHESPEMNPGMACIQCHSGDGGPGFSFAGTVYPTAHEPDLCNGADGTNGATVIITGADGRMLSLRPNRAGNFFAEQRLALPYEAQVVFSGRARTMVAKQTSGDCNACHTQTGTNSAPGRILLP